jgi:predicted dehydrogenase
MKAVIDRGDIGDPASVVHYGASSLMHGHIHSIDTISYLLGDPGIDAVRGELGPDDAVGGNMLYADPRARFDLRMSNGVGVTSVPTGTIEVEVLGSEGSVRALNNNTSITLRRAATGGGRRAKWGDAIAPEWTPRSAVVNCLEDLVDAHETGRPALADAAHSHHMTEACIAVAESHRIGGSWVPLPMDNRDLYVFHV